MIPWMLYMNFNEFTGLFWDFVLGCISCSCKSSLIPGMLYSLVFTVNSLNVHSLFYYNYSYCKFPFKSLNFTVNSLNVHSLFYYNYSYCKFIDILFKRLNFSLIEFSLYIGFIVLENRS